VDRENDKNTVVALREIADGKVCVDDLKDSLMGTFHDRPLQEAHEELDEDPSEDFLNTKPVVISRSPVELDLQETNSPTSSAQDEDV
jgi:hypothetical protein